MKVKIICLVVAAITLCAYPILPTGNVAAARKINHYGPQAKKGQSARGSVISEDIQNHVLVINTNPCGDEHKLVFTIAYTKTPISPKNCEGKEMDMVFVKQQD